MLKSNSSAAVGGYTADEAASNRQGMKSPQMLREAPEAINFGAWGRAPEGILGRLTVRINRGQYRRTS